MILVTGGSGLVGSHILFDLVSSGKKVRALRRAVSNMNVVNSLFSKSPELLNNIEWVEGEVNDIFSLDDAMAGVDTVYHSAAFISFYQSDKNKMLKVNVEGTANVVNMAMKNNISRLCHVSSVAALGRTSGEINVDENSWWKTSSRNSNYAISKYGGEREVWRAMEEGLSAFIINPTIIIGPGNWTGGSTQMFSQVNKGMPYYTNGITGFVDVRDVSKSALLLMEKGVRDQRFIINSENVTYRYVFDLIAQYLGKKKTSIKVTPLLSEIGWRAETIKSWITRSKPMITKETARNGLMEWHYSNEKIRKETGMDFISVEQSVKDTCEVFLGVGGN
jgi:dihydroflavonol-4-reductase